MKVTIEEQTEERECPYLAYQQGDDSYTMYYVYDDVSSIKALHISKGFETIIDGIKDEFIPLPKGTKVILEQE